MRNEIIIENSSLKDFLMDLIKNLGRNEVTTASLVTKKIYQIYRYLTNFNLPGKSRKNIEHHYDIGGLKGEKLYDIFLDRKYRLYSCAYWKDDTKTLSADLVDIIIFNILSAMPPCFKSRLNFIFLYVVSAFSKDTNFVFEE